jgi:hypothetical protein
MVHFNLTPAARAVDAPADEALGAVSTLFYVIHDRGLTWQQKSHIHDPRTSNRFPRIRPVME